jgi:hypothetical protein
MKARVIGAGGDGVKVSSMKKMRRTGTCMQKENFFRREADV